MNTIVYFLWSVSCNLSMHSNSSVQRNLFIQLCVHSVTFLLDRHSNHVNRIFLRFWCCLPVSQNAAPNYLAAKILCCNSMSSVFPVLSITCVPSSLEHHSATVQHLLNNCRNSEDECVWLLQHCLSQRFSRHLSRASLESSVTRKPLNHSQVLFTLFRIFLFIYLFIF